MWTLTRHFAFGYLIGGVVVSFFSCVLIGNSQFLLWQLCIGYMMAACFSGLAYAVGLKLARWLRNMDLKLAAISGGACAVMEYLLSTMIQSLNWNRAILFALPIVAALIGQRRGATVKV